MHLPLTVEPHPSLSHHVEVVIPVNSHGCQGLVPPAHTPVPHRLWQTLGRGQSEHRTDQPRPQPPLLQLCDLSKLLCFTCELETVTVLQQGGWDTFLQGSVPASMCAPPPRLSPRRSLIVLIPRGRHSCVRGWDGVAGFVLQITD